MLCAMVRCASISILSLALVGCCPPSKPEEVTERFTANDEEVEPFLRADGTLRDDACMELCEVNVSFDVEECELVSHDPELTQAWLFECSGVTRQVCF
jgi:hypothetical protein